VVVRMGKAKVGAVADGENLRPILEDLLHHLLGVGYAGGGVHDQADSTDVGDDGDILVGADFLFNPFEDGSVPSEQGFMNLGAGLVPGLHRPRLPVLNAVNFPLRGDDPLGKGGSVVIKQGFPQTLPRATGGDDPADVTFFAGGLKPGEKARGERGGRILVG